MPDLNYNNNLFTFGSDGNLIYNDTAWDDLRFPAIAQKLGGVKDPDWVQIADDNGVGDTGTTTGVYAYAFDKATVEEMFIIGQMPHGWKEGSAVHPHVPWMPTDTGTGTVRWGMECSYVSIDGTLGATSMHYIEDAGDGIAYKHQYAHNGDVDMTGHTISMMFICRIRGSKIKGETKWIAKN